MSVQWLAWAFEHAEATGGQRLVLLSLANHADEAGVCWPSIDTISREARLSRRRVEDALRHLVSSGAVLRQVNGAPVTGHGGHRPNLYRLTKTAARLSTPRDEVAPATSSGPTEQAPDVPSGPDESAPAIRSTSGPDDLTNQARTNRPDKPSVEPSLEPSEPKQPSTALAVVSKLSTAVATTDPVEAVFDAWREATGKTGRTKLDPKRRRRIVAALKDYPTDDVLDAVRGWRRSPFHCGDNTDGRKYNELDLLLRDAQHIEQFRDLERGEGSPGVRPAKAPKLFGQIGGGLQRRGSA